MKISYIVILSLLFGIQSFGANASDLTKIPSLDPHSFFEIAWKSVPTYIADCLNSPTTCVLTSDQKTLLTGIQTEIPKELPLKYVSAAAQPGIFAAIGTDRIAGTTLKIGAPIYINTDEISTVDYPTAIAILTHELGHHQGVTDTNDRVLDLLGSVVHDFVVNKAEIATLKSYNQPQVGLFIYNSGAVTVAGPTTQVLIYDAKSMSDLGAVMSENFPCYSGTNRVGGLQMYQPVVEAPFDWQPQFQIQDFGIDFQMQERCKGAGTDDSVIYTTVYFELSLLPNSGANQENWWKTQTGHLSEANTDAVQNGLVTYTERYSSQYGQPLKVVSVTNPQQNLANSSVWNVQAIVQAPNNLPIESCTGLITSPSFVNYAQKRRYKFPYDTCTFTALANNQYQLNLSYTFPSITPSRVYEIDSFSLNLKGQSIQFSGQPTFVEQSTLTSSSEPTPLTIGQGMLTGPNPSGSGAVTQTVISGPGTFHVSKTDLFGLQFYFNSMSPIKPISYFYDMMDWTFNGKDQEGTSIDVPIVMSGQTAGDWPMPFNGSSLYEPYPNVPGKYIAAIDLRPSATSGPAMHNVLKNIEFLWVWVVNDNLQELFQPLTVQIDADKN